MNTLHKDSRGAALVEYGILIGLLAVLAIGAVLALGERTKTTFDAPTATLGWYVGGITDEFPARYQFTADFRPGNPDVTGFDIDGLTGSSFGSIDEATFDEFNLRSIQYDASLDEITVALSGNTVADTAGHEMRCLNLADGTVPFLVDFDEVPGFFLSPFNSTLYTKSAATAPFDVGQELSCVIQEK